MKESAHLPRTRQRIAGNWAAGPTLRPCVELYHELWRWIRPPLEPDDNYVNEEEVPRAGKIVSRGVQRARWTDGSTFVWLGRRATTGHGEGSSGLAFDQIEDVKSAES
jgi:hypothetical protein